MLTMTEAALLAVVALALGVAGCGGDDNDQSNSGAAPTATQPAESGGDEGESKEEREAVESGKDKACDEAGDIDGKPKRRFPKSLALPSGAHVYESEGPFGKTVRYFAAVDGDAGELSDVRDKAAAALKAKGYKVLDTDQEEGAEAEAHLSGSKGTVDVQVINLCEGKLRIRYTVS